jgi:hypothetical protein
MTDSPNYQALAERLKLRRHEDLDVDTECYEVRYAAAAALRQAASLEARLTRYEEVVMGLRQTVAQLRKDVPLSVLEANLDERHPDRFYLENKLLAFWDKVTAALATLDEQENE